MKIEKLREKAFHYKEYFFFGDLGEILKYYETDEGFFVIGQKDEEKELFWAVNSVQALKEGIQLAKADFNDFIFRYGNDYDILLHRIDLIKSWGYHFKNMHVGFRLDLKHFQPVFNKNCLIEALKEIEIEAIMTLEKSIFDLFHVTKKEYHSLINSDRDIVLTLKKDHQMIGFIILMKSTEKLCLLRNIGVCDKYRGQKYGEALINKGLSIAKNLGFEDSFLWVDHLNQRAINLYKKVGFTMDKKEAEAIFYL